MNQKKSAGTIKILSGGIGDYPIKLELIPRRLTVSIYQHNLLGIGSHIPCWIFITGGMSALKQKEFVLILRLKKGENGKTFPKPPLQLFLFLFKSVLQKKRFNVGDVTRLGEKGLLGFKGLGYTFELLAPRDVPLPQHYLTCILLSTEETLAAQASGFTRVLTRLGYGASRFPALPWNDLERASLPMQAVLKSSEFRELNAISLRHSSVNLVGGDKVVLILAAAIHGLLEPFIKQHGNQRRLGFITQLLPYHDGALVWLPDKDIIEMNMDPDADGEMIAGSFLIMARGEQNGARMLEDGFTMQFDDESWLLFCNAISRRQNLSLRPAGSDMEFNVVWNMAGNPEENAGVNIQSGLAEQGDAHNPASGGWLSKINKLWGRR